MEAKVIVQRPGPVTVVTPDRREVRNAVDARTARALHEALLAFDADVADALEGAARFAGGAGRRGGFPS